MPVNKPTFQKRIGYDDNVYGFFLQSLPPPSHPNNTNTYFFFRINYWYYRNRRTIFQSLGFFFRDDGLGTEASFGLYPPSVELVTPLGRKARAKLLRGWIELSAWVVEFQSRFTPQLKDHGATKPWVSVTSQREHYQEALGAHPDQIPRGEVPVGLRYDEELRHAWKVLGMTRSTYSPRTFFLFFTYCH